MNVLRDAYCPNVVDCPKVYEPIDDGRLPVRGDKVDPALRSKLGPLPDHEDVVLVPPTVLSDVRTHVVRSRYDESCRFHHAEVIQVDAAAPYLAVAELLWDQAVDFESWWHARPGDHRDRAA